MDDRTRLKEAGPTRGVVPISFEGMPIPLEGSCDCPKCGERIQPLIEMLFYKLADVHCPKCRHEFTVTDTDQVVLIVLARGEG